MVQLAITSRGLEDAMRLASEKKASVCGADWAGTPLCVIETEAVDVVPFGEVSATFAAIEGEGDGSLSFWREAHRQYFTRECIRIGRLFSEDMPVACERFRVVYRPCGDAA